MITALSFQMIKGKKQGGATLDLCTFQRNENTSLKKVEQC